MATTLLKVQTAAMNNSQTSDATAALDAINDGYVDVVERTGLGTTSVTKTLVANQTSYTFTSSFSLTGVLKLLDIRYLQSGSTNSFPMQLVSLQDVNQLNGAGVVGFIHAYALQGLDTIVFGPAPGSGDSISLYYTPTPTPLASASDVPSTIPSRFQFNLLSFYASSVLAETESTDLAAAYRQKYEGEVDALWSFLNRRQGQSSKGMRAGYPSRPNIPPHDRSAYFSGSRW